MATVLDVKNTDVPLEEIYARAIAGEEIVLELGSARRVRLVPADDRVAPQRRPGVLKGLIHTRPEDFAPLSDEELEDWGY